MKKFNHVLNKNHHTELWYEYDPESITKIPSYFQVRPARTLDILSDTYFQDGPIEKFGVNGLSNEDVICMVICRVQILQQTKHACHENQMIIDKLEEALMWLHKRKLRITSEVKKPYVGEKKTVETSNKS